MIKIEYPPFEYRIKGKEKEELIFDEIRKKWLKLTPEEWVRQNFIQYILQIIQYPASLIAVEKEIKLGELKKRCDLIIFKNAKPWMIVECKEPNVPITEQTMQQILRYHQALPVPYLCLTNGNNVFLFEKVNHSFKEIKTFPV